MSKEDYFLLTFCGTSLDDVLLQIGGNLEEILNSLKKTAPEKWAAFKYVDIVGDDFDPAPLFKPTPLENFENLHELRTYILSKRI